MPFTGGTRHPTTLFYAFSAIDRKIATALVSQKMIYLFMMFLLILVVIAQPDALTMARMEELATEADELVRDFMDSQRRFTSKIRTRLVTLFLELIPVEIEIQRLENPELQEKFNNIILLLEKKMKIDYGRIKERISTMVTRFVAPTLLPFSILQAPSQEEIQQALLAFETTPYHRDMEYQPINTRRVTNDVQYLAADQQMSPARPYRRENEYQPISTNRLTTDLQYLPADQQTRPSRPYRSQYLPATQRTYQPQYNYLSMNQYPQDYDYNSVSSGQYYWPAYQYGSYQPMVQQQYSPQYYWQQPAQQQVQQRQPSYYWDYPSGRTYYDQNSVFYKY
ncbi:hypothetical protein Y032_0069g361 [Ancylostoma ceylanicum]|uniref:Uncharacterized protein n=1 Tax=Ancylostoma ceylanicum TaxID=53326 RepID=A0A016TYN3_9BILA|nr:hypothetical protein Y032_0069g361 [Ancylostoma ceylanicum]